MYFNVFHCIFLYYFVNIVLYQLEFFTHFSTIRGQRWFDVGQFCEALATDGGCGEGRGAGSGGRGARAEEPAEAETPRLNRRLRAMGAMGGTPGSP